VNYVFGSCARFEKQDFMYELLLHHSSAWFDIMTTIMCPPLSLVASIRATACFNTFATSLHAGALYTETIVQAGINVNCTLE
jgi:hypothetical protein